MRTLLLMIGTLLAALSLGCSSSTKPPSGPGTVIITETTTSTSTTTSIPTTTTTTSTSTIAPLPDLALFTPTGRFCRTNSSGDLIVQVLNQASGDAGPFVTRLTYAVSTGPFVGPSSVVSVASAGLASGVSLDLTFPGTSGCGPSALGSERSCTFTINVDAEGSVAETTEANNIAAGTCVTNQFNSKPAAQ